MKKLICDWILDLNINTYNKIITFLENTKKDFKVLDIFEYSIKNKSFDTHSENILSNIALLKKFEKISKNDFLNFIEDLIKKQEFDYLDKIIDNLFFWDNIHSCSYLFLNENEIIDIIKSIWELLFKKYKDKLNINKFIWNFLCDKENIYWLHNIFLDLYKSSYLEKWLYNSRFILNVILNEKIHIEKEDIKLILKPFLIINRRELDSCYYDVFPILFQNINKYFSNKEISILIEKYPFKITNVLENKNLDQEIIEKMLDIFENKYKLSNDENKVLNFKNELLEITKYIYNNKNNYNQKLFERIYKIITNSYKDKDSIFNEEDSNKLINYLVESKYFPKSLIEEILQSNNNKHKYYVSCSQSIYLNKDHLLDLLKIENEWIISQVIIKAWQYWIDIKDIIWF